MVLFCMTLCGCGTLAEKSEFYKHDSMYLSWNHLWYSWEGYTKPLSRETVERSIAEQWWGIPIEHAHVRN